MTRKWITLVAASLFAASAASASSTASRLDVSAVVVANCRVTVSALNFGAYDPLGQHSIRDLDAAADLTMTCTRSSPATIVLGSGNPVRTLIAAGQRVNYQLYQDEGRTRVWGADGDSLHIISTGISAPQRFVVYGRIPSGQEVVSGIYTDVVTATVDF
jgi:spore coat protein U-like protein